MQGMDIKYPGFGVIVVEGTRFEHDVVIEKGVVRPRDKGPSRARKRPGTHTPLSVAEDIPWSNTSLVIGSGYSGRLPIMQDLRDEARAHGVELVVEPTKQACSMLREADPSEVNAILHVTC